MKSVTLKELSLLLDGVVQGDETLVINSVATLEHATSGQISFLANSKYRAQLESTQASAVLLSAKDAQDYQGTALVVKDPYVGFARVAQLLDTTPKAAMGIHPSAQIDPSAQLGDGVAIGANAVIGANVILGENVQIGAGTVIGQDSIIGSNTRLWANVTLYHNVHLGQDCIIHSGAIIGSDGFGYANERGQWIKIPQTGGVRIGDRVEIGANSTIDRGALGHTEIHNGVIIDNQVQVAHNDIIGENTAIAGSTTIAGSVTIGKHCIIGGNCAIAGHLTIADGVHLSGATNVTGNMREPGLYSSATVAMDNNLWRKNTVRFRQLDELFQRVKAIEKNLNTPE
ncbi:UDP-3-O-(3-hydroxymyristoyl)glucosamine N-acyltransferase [Shewanella oneidensis MR-1]|uniref:UDP-3-O-acylglucosamine N-acyltransferase n=1 Tax=Shewanella oneidensis (strain ATCC 700550 / JCM 31522 / CIP 106686 / LMG 19005 / NCIMB 14063 / MR-1) TaxID=211586 RepID=LPXD_SHEON|nr:UDP-3-O-(3-hydroxymyristoyl)glucosamine N-acyltransferase [Shewanella oneidensis]Q8EGG5.1 RecName: Full=UDP-3-O-acylglucosamine N-acyltransferase [Shewanella oneidensis MR-1]AAN54694.1 UDP-3-O-(3-hydroxymyristoyl) glucosamine n-acyltransferase LpxD [Shewanella oneidensis MR-1]MDX5996556.1 UDP-3-O-(3-hydroxymyristoyl)glucosamine N-acyltransferase [Shewanella oneidensis]MEE2027299.1 UDP-3-O-(3-hydroxymyristoyl)glucosamine N-acyltransferase [Shewanella oneidensis]QKG96342.1 UDP-3-O-(3-hydroxym